MTPAQLAYARAGAQLRVCRAQLLFQIARDDTKISDLLKFAQFLGDSTTADCVAAFRSAQTEQLRAAQAELDRLPD